MQYKKIILSFFILISAQKFIYAQRAEIGVNMGGTGYIGEFNQFNPVKISGVNAGIFAKINIDPYWGVGIHYNYGKIKGDDARSNNDELRNRNLNFKTSLNEIAFIGSLNFFDMYSPGSRKRFSPYLFAGVGGVIFEPTTIRLEDKIKLREYNTEGLPKQYRNYAMTIPYGAGVKYKKNENITLFAQIGYRTTFTDYLDDVSGKYPDPSQWNSTNSFNVGISQELSDRSRELPTSGGSYLYRPGDQRGDFRKRDTYVFVNIGISYTFVSPKCFTF
ncbi:type IX secretion system protein PorG [Pedobacter insulae]|nr:DUF6089 family protein [Pedobacter insulae]